MADKNAKAPNSVAGKFYVDTTCISCGQCVDLAGDFFAYGDDGVYVKAQPTSESDIAACEQTLANCPVEAIGNDGE